MWKSSSKAGHGRDWHHITQSTSVAQNLSPHGEEKSTARPRTHKLRGEIHCESWVQTPRESEDSSEKEA